MTTMDAILKEQYPSERIENLVYQDNALLAMLPKAEDFGGDVMVIPLIYGNPQGRSASISVAIAKAASAAPQLQKFNLTRVKNYSVATMDGETLDATEGNAAAFVSAFTLTMDTAIQSLKRSAGVSVFRSGFGDIGRVGSITSNTIFMLNPSDITNFEVDMTLRASSSQNAAVLRAGTMTITAVDRSLDAPSITVDSVAGVTGLTANDWLFQDGDRQDSATPSALMLSGLAAWLPATAPTSTPFFGVNRSLDVTRLGGQRLDRTAAPIEEALLDGAYLVGREGGKLTHYFMSYEKYNELIKALGSKVQYIDFVGTANVGFRGVEINGPRGVIKCIPDQNCPTDRVYGLQLDTWKLHSLKKFVRVLDRDGQTILRQTNADGYEVRIGYYAQMRTSAPGYNCVISV